MHYVGLGEKAFRRAVKAGEIARIVDGGHPRYLPADLDAYIARKRVPAVSEVAVQREPTRLPIDVRALGPINKVTGRSWEGIAR